jgi:hypothetical protein
MVRGEGTVTKWLIADSGVGVAGVVDAVVEEPPDAVAVELVAVLPPPPTTGAGVVNARVADVAAKEDPVFEDRELLFPLVLANAFVAVDETGEPEDGVSVVCDPVVIAAVRPETLCACVDVPVDD